MSEHNLFAVHCLAKKAISSYNNSVVTKEGDGFWVTIEPEGWVPATSTHGYPDKPPKEVKTWKTIDGANAFMRGWEGHPWYHVPKTWTVVPIKQVMKEVFSHYEPVK